MKEIPLGKRLHDFEEALDSQPRIVFSAKFGEGKTYFLNRFFNRVAKDDQQDNNRIREKYFPIYIYPVDYSIAKNEDVFQYIKRDILVQLLHYYKDNIEWTDRIKAVFGVAQKEEGLDLIVDLLSMLASTVMGVPLLAPVLKKVTRNKIKKIRTLLESYKQELCNPQKLIGELDGQKGSIYENDDFTILITKLLKEAKKIERNGVVVERKVILIIDDLDRLDPGHLFRILNIFSAHVDRVTGNRVRFAERENEVDDQNTVMDLNKINQRNKFGFDNIVTVFDFDTTKKIFRHFYGQVNGFDGYISKFMTINQPFRYSITFEAQDELLRLVQNKWGIFSNFLEEEIRKMSLREIVKVLDCFENKIDKIEKPNFDFLNPEDVNFIKFLHVLRIIGWRYDQIRSFILGDDEKGLGVLKRVWLIRNCYYFSNLFQQYSQSNQGMGAVSFSDEGCRKIANISGGEINGNEFESEMYRNFVINEILYASEVLSYLNNNSIVSMDC